MGSMGLHSQGAARVTKKLGRDSTVDPALQVNTSTLDAPRRIIDLATGLPSLTSLFSDLKQVLEGAAGTTILYVHLASNVIIEERFGWETLTAYNELVHNYLHRFAQDIRRERGTCVVARAFADDYVCIAGQSDKDEWLPSRLVDGMNRQIQAVDDELASLHEVYVGRASVTPFFSRVHPERMLYRGIQRAQQEAMDIGRQRLSMQVRVLDSCLGRPETFSMLFQPLVRLTDHSIFAYEGLARCSHENLRNPHVLFNVAEQGDRIWPLSRLLRKRVLEPAKADLPDDKLLFINLHPTDFSDPKLLEPEPHVQEQANRIVLEVTERAAIGDYTEFRKSIDTLRSYGLRIAIDDLGSGYAALSAAAELDPDYIKFDMTLIRDIDQSPIRQNLVRNMVSFAVSAGCEVVAEGVETKEELDVVKELGCHFVQGYYMARPAATFVTEVPAP
jgi:EAL domain-containing protein (putative c-di-GMP-specific phosphodiesterase class I)